MKDFVFLTTATIIHITTPSMRKIFVCPQILGFHMTSRNHWILKGQYLPRLSSNYVAISKGIE